MLPQVVAGKAIEPDAAEHCDRAYLSTIGAGKATMWNCIIRFDGHEVLFKLDTEAEVTVISKELWASLNGKQSPSPLDPWLTLRRGTLRSRRRPSALSGHVKSYPTTSLARQSIRRPTTSLWYPSLTKPTETACHLVSSASKSVLCALTTPLVMFPESTYTQLTPFPVLLLPPQMSSLARRVHEQRCLYRPSPPICQQVLTASGSIEPHRSRTAYVPSLSHSASMGGQTRINLQEIFYGNGMCKKSFPYMMTYSFEVIILWCHAVVFSAVWWPGIKHQVEQLARSCQPAPRQSHPLLSQTILSPTELTMGRPMRTDFPQVPSTLIPEWSYLTRFRQKDAEIKRKQKAD